MMKVTEGLMNNKQLMRMLNLELQRESEKWSPSCSKDVKNKKISAEHRDDTVRWLAQLNHKFDFSQETFALSVSILDRFLHAVKAHPKYLKCIGVACFYLAAKSEEEDEDVPGTLELVQESHCGCSVAEVLRMERVILDKLHWDLRTVTPLHFLHIFHSLLMTNYPQLLAGIVNISSSQQLQVLSDKMAICNTNHRFTQFSPSTMALAVLSLELEKFWPEWFGAMISFQGLIGVDNAQLIHCRELATSYLSHFPKVSVKYICVSVASRNRSKRKVEQVDEDEIYDSIKRLYSEEPEYAKIQGCGMQEAEMGHGSTPPTALTQAAVAN